MINVVMHSRVSSSIWITDRVRMGSENKWIRLAAMYSILLLYSLYDTEHIDWWLPSLFTWTKTLAIHSYISTWIHYSASGFAQWIRTHGYHHTQSLHAPTKSIVCRTAYIKHRMHQINGKDTRTRWT
eukprot:1086305_1